MNVFFKNIRVINPQKKLDEHLNLWIKDGVIEKLQNDNIKIDNDVEVIESSHLICSPGLFDMHVHFREPGDEYKEDIKSGCAAAANGGFTGVLCMPNTTPSIDNAASVELIKGKASGNIVDVQISGTITQHREGKIISPMLELAEHGVHLFTDDGSCVLDSQVMRRAFDYATTKNLLIAQHCEDHNLTKGFSANEGWWSFKLGLKGYPSVAEEIILSRDIMLAAYNDNCRYHALHISTKGSVALVKKAKEQGIKVTSEATPHHFSLNDENLKTYSSNYKMNPPLRGKKDVEAIIEGLKSGVIDCIASDHAPHALHEKDVELESASYGIVGLETSLGLAITNLVHSGHLNFMQLIEKMSVNPRKILGLPEIAIEEGIEANLTIFNPTEDWIVDKKFFRSKSNNMPYQGMKLTGKPKYVINNNQIFESKL
jgi:dihydroorotase